MWSILFTELAGVLLGYCRGMRPNVVGCLAAHQCEVKAKLRGRGLPSCRESLAMPRGQMPRGKDPDLLPNLLTPSNSSLAPLTLCSLTSKACPSISSYFPPDKGQFALGRSFETGYLACCIKSVLVHLDDDAQFEQLEFR